MATVKRAARVTGSMGDYVSPAATAVTMPPKPKKRICSGVRVEVASNGFTARKDYAYQDGGYYPNSEKEHVFTDLEKVVAFVRKALQ